MNLPVQLTVTEALSGISGSVSLAAWVFLLVRLALPDAPLLLTDLR